MQLCHVLPGIQTPRSQFKRRDKFRLTKKQGHSLITLNRKTAINKSRKTTQHFFTHLQS